MCISQLSSFKEQFPKNHRPEITDLNDFWSKEIFELFRDFAEHIRSRYDLRFGVPVWSEANGWTYRIGRSGVYLIKGIRIKREGFIVDGIHINDRTSYALLLEYVRNVYEQNESDFHEKIVNKNIKQAQRNKARMEREQNEQLMIQDKIISEKYNVFHWPAKLDIYKLKQLYMLDAKGIQDNQLVDEIGLTLYVRCIYGKEDMQRMEKSVIRCHNCSQELAGSSDFRQCKCGYQYSYKEYRRSYRKNNMPTGAASKVFEAFITGWSLAKSYNEKMILIDTLLHEFHLSLISGAVHRPVAMNFIDGTRSQVDSIIKDLARNS